MEVYFEEEEEFGTLVKTMAELDAMGKFEPDSIVLCSRESIKDTAENIANVMSLVSTQEDEVRITLRLRVPLDFGKGWPGEVDPAQIAYEDPDDPIVVEEISVDYPWLELLDAVQAALENKPRYAYQDWSYPNPSYPDAHIKLLPRSDGYATGIFVLHKGSLFDKKCSSCGGLVTMLTEGICFMCSVS